MHYHKQGFIYCGNGFLLFFYFIFWSEWTCYLKAKEVGQQKNLCCVVFFSPITLNYKVLFTTY